jgi:hypothetical protein
MNEQPNRTMKMSRLFVGIAALVALALVVWFAPQPGVVARTGGNLCDGGVPVWYPSEGGCTEIPSLLEHLWPPERWSAPSFCQGLCISIDEAEEQARVRDEWREAHPDAVAH